MGKLIYSEFIKLISKKKNILIFISMVILMGCYVKNMLPKDKDVLNSVISEYKVSLNEISSYVNNKIVPEKTKLINEGKENSEEVEFLREEERFLIDEGSALVNIIYGYRNNNPQEELQGKIDLDELILQCKDRGYTNVKSLDCEVMQQRTVFERRINKNKFLLENNIKQINEDTSLCSFNFLRLISRDILTIVIIGVSLLVAADTVSSENEEGTFKTVLVSNITRKKVLISKIIASTIFSTVLIFLTIAIYFVYLGFVKGFGSINYPFEYCKYSFSFHAGNIFAPEYDIMPGVTYFIIYILFSILAIFMTTVIGILISTVLQNSKASICLSIIIGVVMYKLTDPVGILKKLAFLFPSTYFSAFLTLKGEVMKTVQNNKITFLNGIIVISIFAIVLSIISIKVFKKEDIKC